MIKDKLPRLLLTIPLLTVLAITPQLGILRTASAAANYNVAIQNQSFNPSNLTVHTGDSVIWANNDPLLYELYFQYANGTPITLSPSLKQGDTYSLGFRACTLIQYMTINSPVTTTGTVRVLVQGDVNGNGIVDLTDLILVARSFGATIGTPQYNSSADLDHDGIIDLTDLILVASHFGSTCT